MQIGIDPVNNILNTIINALSLKQVFGGASKAKVKKFEKIYNYMKNRRNTTESVARTYYKNIYRGNETVCVDHLIYQRGWMWEEDYGPFIPISQVQLNINDGTEVDWDDKDNPRPRFLPIRKKGFADNLLDLEIEKNLDNKLQYGLGNVNITKNPDGTMQVVFDILKGRYFDFYDTCQVLCAEIAMVCLKDWNHTKIGKKLQLRNDVGNLFDFSNRFVGIGANCITIIKNVIDQDGNCVNCFIRHKRSGKVAEGFGTYSVIPAGSYQSMRNNYPQLIDAIDKNIGITILREFEEELCGKSEFVNVYDPKMFNLISKAIPEPLFLGIGLDPISTKAEVLACIIIDVNDPKYDLFHREKTHKKISEYINKHRNEEGKVELIHLSASLIGSDSQNPNSMPVYRQILSIILKNRDYFGVSDF